jgi:hypothetical protein
MKDVEGSRQPVLRKCKVKFSLCVANHHAVKTAGGVEVYLHVFLELRH